MNIKHLLIGAAAAALLGSAAHAQTPLIPQVGTVGPNDLFQDIVGGVPQPGNQYVSAAALGGSLANGGPGTNWLIGGRADDNLWQRNTTGTSVTTTYLYGGPDRWAYWSGTSTAMTVSDVTTASALPTGSAHVFRMARTAAQTGVVQMCMAQEITSANSLFLAGHTVELDFYVRTASNFSGTATGMTAYIVYGTGTDEGMQKLAWGLNAGGGGSTAWAGQTNATAAVIPLTAVSTNQNVVAVASIPATATEIGVALCYTPLGTAGSAASDALFFDNIELRKADGLVNFANATTGYVLSGTGGAGGYGNILSASINGQAAYATIPAYSRRLYGEEQLLQLGYYYQINEPAASKPIGSGAYFTTTTCDVVIPTPVPMRIAPTLTIGGATEANTTWAVLSKATTPVALASTYLVQDATMGNTTTAIAVQGTTASTTAGFGCVIVGAGGGANIQASSEL